MSRVAVVTGAASGIGLAIARRLATAGRPRRPARPAGRRRAAGRRGPARDRSTSDRREGRRHRPRSSRRRARQGARGVRTRRDHGHECGARRVRGLHRHHDRDLGACPRRQPHRNVPLPAGRRSRHARGAVGSDGDDLVVERAVWRRAHGALRGVEGRRDRPDEGARARARAARDHGEHASRRA